MRELSLHILDLAQNSIEAGAHNVIIEINENENGFFVFRISDDGHGMSEEMVQKIQRSLCDYSGLHVKYVWEYLLWTWSLNNVEDIC